MTTIVTRTFRSGNSEAIRLPAAMAFGLDTPVTLERNGDTVTVRAVADAAAERQKVLDLVAALRAIGPAGEVEVREPFDGPERAGF
jgi:antitoxin VapB